jgi:hypothetical protein
MIYLLCVRWFSGVSGDAGALRGEGRSDQDLSAQSGWRRARGVHLIIQGKSRCTSRCGGYRAPGRQHRDDGGTSQELVEAHSRPAEAFMIERW